jgi:BirA family transcriptional regulator, biotin operon repressor / biotin---[acetyl-CoA-carboxylase] ligase
MPSSDEITRNNPARIFGKKMFVFDTIDSTNNCARLLAESGTEEGTVVYAEEQTSGRGRLKRKWLSEKGLNLLFSIVFSPDIKEKRYFIIPIMTSVSIVESIRANVPGCEVSVKWPNDILLADGKKIAGILTELTHTYDDQLRVVVGIGINVNQTRFPGELSNTASSLCLATGREIDRTSLLHSILATIEKYNAGLASDPDRIIDRWRSFCTMFGKPVRVRQHREVHIGICRDIDRDGALIIDNENGKKIRILAGDVTSVAFNAGR